MFLSFKFTFKYSQIPDIIFILYQPASTAAVKYIFFACNEEHVLYAYDASLSAAGFS